MHVRVRFLPGSIGELVGGAEAARFCGSEHLVEVEVHSVREGRGCDGGWVLEVLECATAHAEVVERFLAEDAVEVGVSLRGDDDGGYGL